MKKKQTPPVEAQGTTLPQGHTPQRRLLKKRRAGVVLSREEVRTIQLGRKKLRRELRKKGIKKRKDFELTASSLGLYFDKNRLGALLLWLLHGRGLWALLGAAGLLLTVLFAFSLISQMQGHFTINLTGDLLKEGFVLSETADFKEGSMRLFAEPATDVPCFSLADLHEDVNDVDGQHNEAGYFAYTFYIRNEGENTVDYDWELVINSESRNLTDATWVMFFEDNRMNMYAKARTDGSQEALPGFGDNSRGYLRVPLADRAASEDLYRVVATRGGVNYYRVVPTSFESDDIVTSGTQLQVAPMETHKYTIVIWLEGDDPDCTDELIGGHAGVEMRFHMAEEEETDDPADSGVLTHWDAFWDNLLFWKD
ncbi:MAG: hypothetical protein E7457_02795 [Ruminococcaceae bacterium]|nr:hypothetical protein [Oscillospiraceae bacterium]